ncbi:MAG: outer membrane protein assembly factor BamA [Gammaproteobacteria bacterium]|nr:outer membrane protein assembly factor BamA [Gammaproteobacteria bacterium]NIR84160.1 outer membrane protein assembly factor BamA [Gammaproteobacteria bacterium]NIR89472.1 outer membrane protein assembly factor BamA [Gammaproteobacteria bacterium]NIU05315.1 outer membrane protein assembly factor BamA [Gammaproteobacteria bacterium]NIV52255.1 outer membrane protein assembly factor BamA [Gammaproteobacteria bacterium]
MRRVPGLFGAALALIFLWTPGLRAQESFVVEDIRLEGLQRISAGTVFNYLPIEVGDRVDQSRTGDAIRALFRTGFFKDVRIARDGRTLVISVEERPSIAQIDFSGNEAVDTEELRDSLKQVGFAEGRAFDRSVFEQVEQELRRTYFSMGKYAVQIDGTVTPLERNRVAVRFDIAEGQDATIEQINFVGNATFDDEELLDEFQLTKSKWYLFFSTADRYSRQKLSADLERLRSFYLDRGFIKFNIDSTQVSITPDKKDVYITVNITEGERYTIEDIKLAGELIVPKEELFELIRLSRGSVFSRKAITETTQKLTERLGEDGYAFANVNAVPEIDDENNTVALTFFVDPGKRVYVRRINFSGNTRTRDEVLRREMRQIEGGWISTSAIERSKVRLERLGFFEEVNVETPAVPGTTDQVDVNFNVVERPSGAFIAGVGFAQTQGVILNASITQENFLGTGNRVGIDFNNSDVNRQFGGSFFNPYLTDDGVSLGLSARYEETDAKEANISDYTLDEARGGATFGVPVTEFDTINVGVEFKHSEFNPGSGASEEVRDFVVQNGDKFDDLVLTSSFSRDSRNSRLLPDQGTLHRFFGEATTPQSDLEYYKVGYNQQTFFPLTKNFTLMLEGEIAFGDGYGDTDKLPLFENFFTGGVRSVRGFEDNTLGPRDSQGDPIGGNLKVVGNAAVILPVPFAINLKSFRMTAFFDIGNVYDTAQRIDLSELRSSTGLGVVWLSPFGAVTISGAVPLKKESGDDTQPIQFTFGTTF